MEEAGSKNLDFDWTSLMNAPWLHFNHVLRALNWHPDDILLAIFWIEMRAVGCEKYYIRGLTYGNIIRNIKALYRTNNCDFWTSSHHFLRNSRNLSHFRAIDESCRSPKWLNIVRNINLLHYRYRDHIQNWLTSLKSHFMELEPPFLTKFL